MNSVALAFGLLTVVPVRGLPGIDRSSAARAMLLAPLTTVPMVAVLALAHLVIELTSAPVLVVAGLVLVVEALVTRALHHDGLADTADGLSAGPDRDARLRAMKASDTGPSGVVALVLVLLLQAAALGALLGSPGGTVLAGVAWVVSRHALAWACRRAVPAATPGGLGALVAGTVGAPALVITSALVLASSALAAASVSMSTWWHGPVVVVAGLAAAEVVVRRCRASLGGVTGDVLGAAVQVALTAALVAAASLVG